MRTRSILCKSISSILTSSVVVGSILLSGSQQAEAQTLYWDTNGATAGSGAATGGWANAATLWSTSPAGTVATVATTTASTNDLVFSAGTNGTAGTVTLTGTQLANSLTFDDPVNITVTAGTISLGSAGANPGLFFPTNSGANTIASAVSLNPLAAGGVTFSNSVTGTQVISGIISGAVPINVNNIGTGAITFSGANTYTGGLTLTAGTLNLNSAASLGAGVFTIAGGTIDYTNTANTNGSFILTTNNQQAWNGDFTFGGTRSLTLGTGLVTMSANRIVTVNNNVGLAARSTVSGMLTVGGVVGGSGFSLTKAGNGTLSLTNTANTFNGGVNITGGALRLSADGSAITNNNVAFNGGVVEFAYAPAASYTLGTGAGQFNFVGDGGFSASGADRSVTLNGGAALTWGTTANFVGNGSTLKLGGTQSANIVTLTNAIDLGAATRTISATRGTAANVVDAVLSGAVTNGSLTKTGNGSLRLTSASTALTGTTTIAGGTLIFANQTTAIANTNIVLDGGVFALPSANFTAALGSGNGQVRFAGGSAAGGFSAFGADRTVNIGNAGATLTWDSTPNFLQTGALILSSSSSNNLTALTNGLDLNGANRVIQVEDGNAGDDARLDGVISGAAGIIKTGGATGGGGRLVMNAVNTYTGSTVLRQGELVIRSSVLNGVAGPLGNSSSPIVIGDASTLASVDNNATPLVLRVRPAAGGLGDNQAVVIERPIDFSQAPNANAVNNNFPASVPGRYRISIDPNGGGGADTGKLTLSGPITFGNNRPVEFYVDRAGQTIEVTGNISGTGGTLYLTGVSNGASSPTDGRANGTFRFSNVNRTFTNTLSVTLGTLIIEGSVPAAGASPIGTAVPSFGDGNGGNILLSNGRDAVRGVFLETPGSSYARTTTLGGGTGVTPTAGAQQTAYGTGSTAVMNGYRFGGVNTSGTVTFSAAINGGGINASVTGTAGGLGGTNPIISAHNLALLSATGGTVDFTGAITGSTAVPLGLTGTPGGSSGAGNNTRITINQFRNHPNLDATLDGIADAGIANALVGSPTAGTVVLSGSNTFGSSTEILGGTLRLNYATNNTSKLADAAASAFILSGGTVELAGGTHTEVVGSTTISGNTANSINRISGTSTLRLNTISRSTGGLVNFGGGSIADTDTVNTNGILGPWATVGGADFAANSTDAADGAIVALAAYTDVPRTDSGAQVIVDGATSNVRLVEGTGAVAPVTLSAATTTIGTLNQSASGGFSAATIDPAGQTLAVGGVLVGTGAGGLVIGTGTNNGTVTAATNGGELILQNYASNALTVNAVIADNATASSLTVGGTGTSILTGVNTYTGATVISSGALNIRNASALGTAAAGTTVSNGGALEVQGGITVSAEGLTLAGAGVANAGALRNVSDTNTISGPIVLTGDTRINSDSGELILNSGTAISLPTIPTSAYTLTLGGAGTIRVASVISISNTGNGYLGSVTKDGPGTVILTRSNTYLGQTTVSEGTLQLGDGTAGNDGTLASQTVVNNGTVDFNHFGNNTYAGTISGDGDIAKRGTGGLTLSGTNTFTGSTTVSNGGLTVSGSLSGTTELVINSGNITLGAANRINDAANLTMNDGFLFTGGFSETLNTLDIEGNGTFNLGAGASILSFANSSAEIWNGTLSIAGWSGSVTGGGTDQLFFGTDSTGLTGGQVAAVTFLNPLGFSPGVYPAELLPTGELVAIPEPTSLLSLLGGVGVLLGLRRRRSA